MLGEGQEENSFKCCKNILAVYQQEWNWGPHGLLTRECQVPDGKYLSPVSGYVQTSLTAGGCTRPVTDSMFLMLSARFFVKGPVTQSPWCQPRSMPVKDSVPAPEFCHHWAKQSLLLSSDLYCYSCYETLTRGSNFSTGSMDCLCFSLPGTLKDFYFFNKIEYSHAWAGVRIS